jgi:hypothetical protein
MAVNRFRRVAVLATMVGLVTVGGAGVAAAETINPLDGILPDPSLITGALQTAWQRWVAAIWFLLLVFLGVRWLIAGASVRKSRHGGSVGGLSDATEDLRYCALAFVAVAAATPIVGGILYVTTG